MDTPIRMLFALCCALACISATTHEYPLVSADLSAGDLYCDWSAQVGERIDFSFTVENVGDAASESCYWGVYISAGAYYLGSKIDSGTIYALDPGETDRCWGTCEIPDDLEPGYYYLYAVADDGDYVSDSDRSNNVVYASFQVIESER